VRDANGSAHQDQPSKDDGPLPCNQFAMSRYFFDVRDADELAVDDEGLELAGHLPFSQAQVRGSVLLVYLLTNTEALEMLRRFSSFAVQEFNHLPRDTRNWENSTLSSLKLCHLRLGSVPSVYREISVDCSRRTSRQMEFPRIHRETACVDSAKGRSIAVGARSGREVAYS
jgi:hypothetical protein